MRESIFLPVTPACIALVAACAADWPMEGGNPQRTNRTADSPKPIFSIAWTHKLPGERIYEWNMPIAAAGKVFIGSVEGVFHCWPLSAADYKAHGAREFWSFKANGPILHAAAYEGGRIFFGSMDGCCYALNAEDGALLWKYDVGRPGFSQAALAADGMVFFGSRTGVFHAFDSETGAVLWRFECGAPILAGAAYDAGAVYVAAEDMTLRAFDAKTGKILWQSEPMPGSGVLEYHPVVHAGTVVVRTKPYTRLFSTSYSYTVYLREPGKPLTCSHWYIYPDGNALEAGKAFWKNQNLPRAERLAAFNAALRDGFERDPLPMTYHVFDAATGKRPYLVPVVFNVVNTGVPIPPVVGPDEYWYVTTTLTFMGNTCQAVKIDPATGDIVDTLQEYVGGNEDGWGGKYFAVMPDGSLAELNEFYKNVRWVGDEPTVMSVGDSVLYWRNSAWTGTDLFTRIDFDWTTGYAGPWVLTPMQDMGHARMPFAISGRHLLLSKAVGEGTVVCIQGAE